MAEKQTENKRKQGGEKKSPKKEERSPKKQEKKEGTQEKTDTGGTMMSFSDLFSKSWDTFTNYAGQLIGFFFAQLGITAGIGLLWWVVFMAIFAVIIGSAAAFSFDSYESTLAAGVVGIILMILLYFVFIFIILFVESWLSASQYYIVEASAEGRKEQVGEALKKGWSLKWKMLGLVLLLGLIVYGGMLFLVIPGLYFLVRLIFAPMALVLEDKGITDSLRRSWELTDGRFWAIVGRVILFFLIFLIPMIIPFVNIIAGFFVAILSPVFMYLLYRSAKEQQDNA